MQNSLTVHDLLDIYRSDIEEMELGRERPIHIRNTPFALPDGRLAFPFPKHYSDIIWDNEWLTLLFSEEQDKKGLYSVFLDGYMRMPKYDESRALTIYYDAPGPSDLIEPPDIIIDEDVVEIKLDRDPWYALKLLNRYFVQKEKLISKL
jgi:hypothetical protein